MPMCFEGFKHTDLETREDFGCASRKKDRLASSQKINSGGFMVLQKLC